MLKFLIDVFQFGFDGLDRLTPHIECMNGRRRAQETQEQDEMHVEPTTYA